MIVKLSEAASNTMLDVLAAMMDGGRLELRAGDGTTLAVLKLSDPAAMAAAGGEIEFNKITEEDAALARGQAEIGRLVGADGGEIFTCDIGDANSDAVIRLNTTQIYRNSPVRIGSFRLVMP